MDATTHAAAMLLASEIRADLRALATLRQADGDGPEYDVPLGECWQPLPGRAGVQLYHVPHPSGVPGLFLTIFCAAPGAHYTASHLHQSRLVAVLDGDLACNDQRHAPGSVFWLAPGEPTTWRTQAGAVGATLYDVPPHDVNERNPEYPDLLPTS